MSAGYRELSINSNVFSWLFRTSGCSEHEVLEKTDLSPDRWHALLESSDKVTIPLTTMKDLAELYNRPITAFLIPYPPKDNPVPKDFRRAPVSNTYSKEMHKKFIKAQKNLKLFVDMKENLGESIEYNYTHHTIDENPFDVAESERLHLNLDEVNISKKSSEAWKDWCAVIGNNNIPVFQYNLNSDGLGGFVTKWDSAYGIVVNSGDNHEVRIFTLFHEYAHILLGIDSVCSDDGTSSSNREIDLTERWCDNFAGAFLMPYNAIVGNKKIIDNIDKREYVNAATELSRQTSVSRSAALVRLRVCGLIPRNACSDELKIWKEAAIKSKTSDINDDTDSNSLKKEVKIDPAKNKLRELGPAYVSLAEKNYATGKITYLAYLDAIRISKSSHERLRRNGVLE